MSNDNENVIGLTAKDQADLEALAGEEEFTLPEPEYHTLLEVWTRVLEPSLEAASEAVTSGYAGRIVNSYPGIGFADMNDFRDLYFAKLEEMKNALAYEIATDEECLNHTSRETDVEFNSLHYRNLLLSWNTIVLAWEMAWDTTSNDAAIELGTTSEIYKMFFGEQGITQHLGAIGFEFTEDDQQELTDALEEFKVGSDV